MKHQVCQKKISTPLYMGRSVLFASLLVANTLFSSAAAQDIYTPVGLDQFTAVNDATLSQIQGQGLHYQLPTDVLPLSIILWDEGGKGQNQGQDHGKPKHSVDVIVSKKIGTQQ